MNGHVLAEQSKFMYYMIALIVTAIGSSVHITLDLLRQVRVCTIVVNLRKNLWH